MSWRDKMKLAALIIMVFIFIIFFSTIGVASYIARYTLFVPVSHFSKWTRNLERLFNFDISGDLHDTIE